MAEASPLIKRLEEFFEVVEIYKKQLDVLLHEYPKKRSLDIDYKDLERFDPQLADELLERPDIILDTATTALQNLVLPQAQENKFEPHVRFFNLGDEMDVHIEDIGADHIQKLIKIKGVITKRAEVKPKVKVALLKCKFCDASYKIPITKNTLMPDICESCRRRSLRMVDEESYFVNLQRAEMQELLERLRGGSPASNIELWLEDDLVNSIIPGDNVEITGILRIRPPTKVKTQASYSKFIDVLHVQRVQREFEEVELSEEDKQHIIALSKDPDIFNKIAESIAPGIYGHEEVKRALTLQLFGGTPNKELPGGGKIRNDIHLLLIGDPGAAKCVDGDTKVALADGSVEPIKEIVEKELQKGYKKLKDEHYTTGNHDIFSLNLDCKITNTKATVFHKIKAPKFMYQIETLTGKTVTVTPEHPFFIYQNGFVKSKRQKM
ncbi:hypothetical protein HY570_02505 [Candidatus Micrarchaeota archaeon]|nr:hypothetical protein [Candidatus Micrarchaeota archaeon]